MRRQQLSLDKNIFRPTVPRRLLDSLVTRASGAVSGRTGKRCKYGVRADGFCKDAPAKVDTLVRRPVADTLVHVYRGGPTGGSTGGGGATTTIIGGGGALMSGAKSIAGYLASGAAARAALKGGGVLAKAVFKRTPVGRIASAGQAAFELSKLLRAGQKVGGATAIRALLKSQF